MLSAIKDMDIAKTLEALTEQERSERMHRRAAGKVAGATLVQLLAALAHSLPLSTLSLFPSFSDATMKYVYRAMSTGQNCAKLLAWHDKLYEKDGSGIIMRALVDRKING